MCKKAEHGMIEAVRLNEELRAENARLRAAGDAVVQAFEALGRARDFASLMHARQKCESVLVALDAALRLNARLSGGTPSA